MIAHWAKWFKDAFLPHKHSMIHNEMFITIFSSDCISDETIAELFRGFTEREKLHFEHWCYNYRRILPAFPLKLAKVILNEKMSWPRKEGDKWLDAIFIHPQKSPQTDTFLSSSYESNVKELCALLSGIFDASIFRSRHNFKT